MDWPILKTLDISLCQTSEDKAFKTQDSVTVARALFAAKNENTIYLIPSLYVFS